LGRKDPTLGLKKNELKKKKIDEGLNQPASQGGETTKKKEGTKPD